MAAWSWSSYYCWISKYAKQHLHWLVPCIFIHIFLVILFLLAFLEQFRLWAQLHCGDIYIRKTKAFILKWDLWWDVASWDCKASLPLFLLHWEGSSFLEACLAPAQESLSPQVGLKNRSWRFKQPPYVPWQLQPTDIKVMWMWPEDLAGYCSEHSSEAELGNGEAICQAGVHQVPVAKGQLMGWLTLTKSCVCVIPQLSSAQLRK